MGVRDQNKQRLSSILVDPENPVIVSPPIAEAVAPEEVTLFLKEVTQQFCEDTRAGLADLRQTAPDQDELGALAHAIAGGAGNLGLSRLVKVSRNVEQSAGGFTAEEIPLVIDILEEEFDQAVAALQESIDKA